MNQHLNKFLILALGIAIGVIAMLLKDRPAQQAAPTSRESPQVPVPTLESSILPEPAVPVSPVVSSPDSRLAEEPTDADTAAFAKEMQRVLRGEATEDEQLAFWQGIQTSKRLDAFIADLQKTASEDSEDVATRLTLARAYVTKIRGTAAGPAQGLWAAKAQSVWEEVLETEPDNWEAQHSIGFSYSQYPDFLNKTGAAITEYERTIEIQEAAAEPRSRFARSYLELAKLHLKNGDPSNALATLEKGVAKHPDNEDLATQLSTIASSYRFEEADSEE